MRAAVLGSPISHSLSPVLHRAAYEALGLEAWTYDRVECTEARLRPFLDGLGPGWAGVSLTMPLKRTVLDLADEVSPLACATGAANTLLLRDGRRFADNTDVAGLVTPLRAAGVTGSARAVVLGAGGTAQASLAALRELGVADVTVLVRDPARAADLRHAASRLGVTPLVEATLPDARRTAVLLGGADVVISTLPRGAADGLADLLDAPPAVLLDVIYAPWPTALAAACTAAGGTVLGGLEMLLHQAVVQVELMTGLPAPVDAMRTALDVAVPARA